MSVIDGERARVRLLKFLPLFACGGTERHVVALGTSLDQRRFDLQFGCLHRWGHFLADVERRGLSVRAFPIDRFASIRSVSQQVRLAWHLRRDRVDIAHSYSFYGNVFALPAARLAGTPVVIASIRDQGAYLTAHQRAVQRLACRLADRILVNADAVKDWLVDDGYDPSRIVVIRNGIDMSRFDNVVPDAGLRGELNIPESARLIAMIARLSPSKGIEHLIDAMPRLCHRHPDIHLVIVGEGLVAHDGIVSQDHAYLRSLRERAERLGVGERIAFTGYRADVPGLLSQISVSVLPSLSEGLSNVVLESMAAGVPVVATRVGGTPEIIDEGRTGYLVPAADSPALAAAISRLLDDPAGARRMGEAARAWIDARFSMRRMVEATEQLYVELLDRKRAGAKRRRAARSPIHADA